MKWAYVLMSTIWFVYRSIRCKWMNEWIAHSKIQTTNWLNKISHENYAEKCEFRWHVNVHIAHIFLFANGFQCLKWIFAKLVGCLLFGNGVYLKVFHWGAAYMLKTISICMWNFFRGDCWQSEFELRVSSVEQSHMLKMYSIEKHAQNIPTKWTNIH